MMARAADCRPVDNILRRTKAGEASVGSLPRRHHLFGDVMFGDVTFTTDTLGQLMPHSPPRTQVMRPSLLVHPIELGRGEASSGAMDSMSSMPRGLPDPGPRDYFTSPHIARGGRRHNLIPIRGSRRFEPPSRLGLCSHEARSSRRRPAAIDAPP